MRLLLDTHYVYELAGAPGRLSAAERKFLVQPESPLLVSAVSIWEIRLKWRALRATGEPKGPIEPEQALSILAAQFSSFLPLLALHAATALLHPLSHNDPFDELLMVQAQVEGARLLTRDAKLAVHPLAVTVG